MLVLLLASSYPPKLLRSAAYSLAYTQDDPLLNSTDDGCLLLLFFCSPVKCFNGKAVFCEPLTAVCTLSHSSTLFSVAHSIALCLC